ncbi:MAG: DUF4810 domain-containing protein [Gammaproteobacteria bacterium]|nr:DUF4810 domain-containing protein [Gammaproteobacteria bacterium]
MNQSRLRAAAIVSFAITAMAIQALFGVVYAADKRMYYWSGHQRVITSANNTPGKIKSSEAALLKLIKKTDEAGRRVAPGLLAEYGYFFFERGEFDTAIYWFEREIGEWPESAVLMKKMIERAREGLNS